MKYTEHDKLDKVKKESQSCGEFLEWLQNEKELVLSQYSQYSDTDETLYPIHVNIQDLLAEFFGIDLNKLEEEKRHMLETLRKANEKREVKR